MKKLSRLVTAPALVLSISCRRPAQRAEPNDDFATATGPLTAGQTFKSDPRDHHRSRLPVLLPARYHHRLGDDQRTRPRSADRRGQTVAARSSPRSAAPARASAAAGRRGCERTCPCSSPQKATVKLNLLPGKYFIPIGHNTDAGATRPADVPIPPPDRARRLDDRFARDLPGPLPRRAPQGGPRPREHQADERADRQGEKNDAPTGKIVKLKLKLKDKRAKAKAAKKAEKFACSIPR